MIRRLAFVALLLLMGCGPERSEPAAPQATTLRMPTIEEVLPPSYSDGSCECRLRNQCANVADAILGRFEGRNLQCRVEDAARGNARCGFEARFVDETHQQNPRPGPWERREGVFHNYGRGAWCPGGG